MIITGLKYVPVLGTNSKHQRQKEKKKKKERRDSYTEERKRKCLTRERERGWGDAVFQKGEREVADN